MLGDALNGVAIGNDTVFAHMLAWYFSELHRFVHKKLPASLERHDIGQALLRSASRANEYRTRINDLNQAWPDPDQTLEPLRSNVADRLLEWNLLSREEHLGLTQVLGSS